MATTRKSPTQNAEPKAAAEKKPAVPEKSAVAAAHVAGKKATPQSEPLQNAGQPQDRNRMSTKRISADEIARRAHELWLQRGAKHGNDHEDWLRAERELKARDS